MGLGTILELKAMLTPRNLQFLSVVLDLILRSPEVVEVFWPAFARRFTRPTVVEEAMAGLAKIEAVLREYRGK